MLFRIYNLQKYTRLSNKRIFIFIDVQNGMEASSSAIQSARSIELVELVGDTSSQTSAAPETTVTCLADDILAARRLLFASHLFAQFAEVTFQFCITLFLSATTNYSSFVLISTYGFSLQHAGNLLFGGQTSPSTTHPKPLSRGRYARVSARRPRTGLLKFEL